MRGATMLTANEDEIEGAVRLLAEQKHRLTPTQLGAVQAVVDAWRTAGRNRGVSVRDTDLIILRALIDAWLR